MSNEGIGVRQWLLILIVFLAGCGFSGDEVSRTTSPDKRFDAVVVEDSGGATTAYWYNVCVVPVGDGCTDDVASFVLYDALRNSNASGVNTRWDGSSHLVVTFLSAKRVRKRVVSVSLEGGVAVELRPGVTDPLAPPGSMFRAGRRRAP